MLYFNNIYIYIYISELLQDEDNNFNEDRKLLESSKLILQSHRYQNFIVKLKQRITYDNIKATTSWFLDTAAIHLKIKVII